MRRRIALTFAQLGPKAGAAEVMALLLEDAALPGEGWRTIDERSWRTGVDNKAEWARAARKAGSVTAWRSFAQPARDRWCWIQVTPMADPEHGPQLVDTMAERQLKNLASHNKVVEERHADAPVIPGIPGIANLHLSEQDSTGPAGPSTTVLAVGTVGSNALIASFSAPRGSWDRSVIFEILRLQVNRLS